MRLAKEFVVLCYLAFVNLVNCKIKNKKTNSTAIGRQGVANQNWMMFDRAAYPEPLPTDPPAKSYVLSPYKALFQGIRYPNDTRVFRKRFEYDAMLRGQQIACQGLFDCILSYLAIESTEAIPVLLRGGVGYRHFTVILKAKANHELKGQVRAYCRGNYEPQESLRTSADMPRRRFYFGELEDQNNAVD